jgi:hypothetical protein
MKCPKCGYVSFDNNQVCTKCNRDISYEQEKLNFPAFRPNPPSLLGALTGDVIESHVDMQIDQSYSEDVSTDIVSEEDVNYEDPGVIGMGEVTFDDSGALDRGDVVLNDSEMDVDLELGDTNEFDAPDSFDSLPPEEAVADLDLDRLNDNSEIMMDAAEPEIEQDEGISLAMDDFIEEEPEIAGMASLESAEDEEAGDASIDMGDLSMKESASMGESEAEEPEIEDEEPGIDFDSMAADVGEDAGDEVALGLDDLQIDESGELEIRSETDIVDSKTETLLDLEDIDLELDMDDGDK